MVNKDLFKVNKKLIYHFHISTIFAFIKPFTERPHLKYLARALK